MSGTGGTPGAGGAAKPGRATDGAREARRAADPAPEPGRAGVTRRDWLLGAGGVLLGAAGGAAATATAGGRTPETPSGGASTGGPSTTGSRDATSGDAAAVAPPRGTPVAAAGVHQAGVTRPATPQPHGLLAVADLGDPAAPPDLAAVGALLAAVGDEILRITDPDRFDDAVTPDGPGDLTVTVGLGPRIVAAVDPALPAAAPMPAFRDDDRIDPARAGGDLLVAVHASDPLVLPFALAAVEAAGEGAAPGLLRRRWAEQRFRAFSDGPVARNPLGYLDGIRVPRTDAELDENVWLGADGDDPRVAGATVCVVRRLVLDVARFTAEPQERRDAVVGRHRVDGSPLSGGGPLADVDLVAKTPEGQYRTPARSHARAAHPSFTGSGLMLRRSYAFATPAAGASPGESGLFFTSFQRDLQFFVRTQLRLDEADDLMEYATPTGTGSWLVLPGFDAERKLGATLFA